MLPTTTTSFSIPFILSLRYCLHRKTTKGRRGEGMDERVYFLVASDRLNSGGAGGVAEVTAATVFSTGHLFHDPFNNIRPPPRS